MVQYIPFGGDDGTGTCDLAGRIGVSYLEIAGAVAGPAQRCRRQRGGTCHDATTTITPLESKTSGRTGCCGSHCGTTSTPGDSVPLPSFERVADGHYRINLIAELQRDQALNSRMALIPILEGQAFEKLEILCDHVPRWFSSALIELNLRAESQVTAQGVNMLVFPNH